MAFEMMEDGSSGTIIKVIGVGGAGGNAVNTMIRRKMRGSVEFIVANTDRQALAHNEAGVQIQLGSNGLGAGGRPEVGASAANEAREEISKSLQGADMVFITAGMGGGTGTGAAPIVAEVAQELGILSVGVVTRPFTFEGSRRKKNADGGIQALKGKVNSLIVILNDKLETQLGEDATLTECFEKADEVLYNACAGIAETIEGYGKVHRDFHDVQTVLSQRGSALMGTGEAEGPDRAAVAAEEALACPLLEGGDCTGAKALLVNFTSSENIGMKEIRTAMEMIRNFADPDAEVFFGTITDETMGDRLRVSIIAAGIGQEEMEKEEPKVQPFQNASFGPFSSKPATEAASKKQEAKVEAPKEKVAVPNPFAKTVAKERPEPPRFATAANSPFQASPFQAAPRHEPHPEVLKPANLPPKTANDLFASLGDEDFLHRQEPRYSPDGEGFSSLDAEYESETNGLWGSEKRVKAAPEPPPKEEKRGFLDNLDLPRFLRKRQ